MLNVCVFNDCRCVGMVSFGGEEGVGRVVWLGGGVGGPRQSEQMVYYHLLYLSFAFLYSSFTVFNVVWLLAFPVREIARFTRIARIAAGHK